MAKPAHPLLSLQASGTIGKAVTFQKSGRLNIARSKPEIPYSLTPAQLHHRRLYFEASQLWHALTPAEKQIYRQNAVPLRLSAFNLFVKDQLNFTKDLLAYWSMDDTNPTIEPDYSPNRRDLTIHGASRTPGKIFNAFDFNGTSDYLDAGYIPAWDLQPPFTIEILFYAKNAQSAAIDFPMGKQLCWFINYDHPQDFYKGSLVIRDPLGGWHSAGPETITHATWHLKTATFDGTTIRNFLDGTPTTSIAANVPTLWTNNEPLLVGSGNTIDQYSASKIDETRLHKRILPDTEILWRAKRCGLA